MNFAQIFLAIGAELPTGFNNPITTGTVLFQDTATFRASQIFFHYRAVAAWTFLSFPVAHPSAKVDS